MYFDWQYRVYVLRGAARLLVLPPFVWYLLVSRTCETPFGLAQGLGAIALDRIVQWGIRSYRAWRARRLHGAHLPPTLKGRLPGNIDWVLATLAGRLHTGYAWKPMLDQVGGTTVNARLLWSDLFVTTDERLIKQMLTNSFDEFVKGDTQQLRLESMLGNGIFNRDGHLWKMHRTMTRPFFVRERISDIEVTQQHTDKFISHISSISRSGPHRGALDIQDLISHLTMDVGSAFLLGRCLGTLDHPLPSADSAAMGVRGSLAPPLPTDADEETHRCAEFVRAFETLLWLNEQRSKSVIWMLTEFFNDTAYKHVGVARKYLDGLIERATERAKIEKPDNGGTEATTLLDFMVANCDDKTIIRDELINVMLAARDTTASAITFTTYLLCRHPDVYRRVREEVTSAFGRDGTPDITLLRQMRYLRAVINESLRLFPPVSFNMRAPASPAGAIIDLASTSTQDGTRTGPPERIYIPADTNVVYIPVLMQRRKDLWGDDAEEFNPDRWIDPERIAQQTKNPFMFLPFNAGPRICLGQQFAYNEVSIAIARMAQRFASIELAEDVQPANSKPPPAWKTMEGRVADEKIWPSTAITMFIKGGLWVRFQEENASD